jgi:hypothetical protein
MLLKIRVVGRCAGAMHKILGHLDHWEPYRFAKKNQHYSITSSARASTVAGMSMRSVHVYRAQLPYYF